MKAKISKLTLSDSISQTMADPQAIQDITLDMTQLPPTLFQWLGRLKLLYGVPFNYLVPDVDMLPPESIRFFYLDENWIGALVDGAYSIGRNLSSGESACSTIGKNIDMNTLIVAHAQSDDHKQSIRDQFLGLETPEADDTPDVLCGFVLRSKIVNQYPGLGVNAYEKGHTPQDPDPQMIKILRMETLGDKSDTLICILQKDAYRIDIHEAPEVLHYGIDSYEYDADNDQVTANKSIWEFTRNGDDVHLETDKAKLQMDLKDSFRPKTSLANPNNSRRTVMTDSLAELMKTTLDKAGVDVSIFNSAEFGVEMVEGVGNVKFFNKDEQG